MQDFLLVINTEHTSKLLSFYEHQVFVYAFQADMTDRQIDIIIMRSPCICKR